MLHIMCAFCSGERRQVTVHLKSIPQEALVGRWRPFGIYKVDSHGEYAVAIAWASSTEEMPAGECGPIFCEV